MHDWWYVLLFVVAAWTGVWILVVYWCVPWLASRLNDGALRGFTWVTLRCYLRLVHHVKWVGFDRLPDDVKPGGTGQYIVVSNHSAGVDPLLIQAGLRRHLRWLMAKEMFVPILGFFWKWEGMIQVSYGAADDAMALREAARHLRDGGLLGIFAEGGIARPPKELRPFQPGVGLLSKIGRAPVLLFWIHGTRYTQTPWGSIFKTSHSVVEFIGVYDFSKEPEPATAVEKLREAIHARSGWPLNDVPHLVDFPPHREEATSPSEF